MAISEVSNLNCIGPGFMIHEDCFTSSQMDPGLVMFSSRTTQIPAAGLKHRYSVFAAMVLGHFSEPSICVLSVLVWESLGCPVSVMRCYRSSTCSHMFSWRGTLKLPPQRSPPLDGRSASVRARGWQASWWPMLGPLTR
jgi:hypothetical protein